MKYFLTVLLCAFIAASFTGRKCDHVFVQVEQAEIKIEQPTFSLGGLVYREYSGPTGKQEGKELICVKCFHKQRQILDYGSEQTGPTLGSLKFDTCLNWGGNVFKFDTANVILLK